MPSEARSLPAGAFTMEQTKALNALEVWPSAKRPLERLETDHSQPFLALSKSATSPRAAADLVTRATSAPNTFIFAELLQTPQIQALASDPSFAPHHRLLQLFSWGTYQSYRDAASDLPALSEAQTQKLRQLSLLTLARDRAALTYDALLSSLGLDSTRQLEDLVVTAVYAGLLDATLDPARRAVQVSRIAPLRDLPPGAVPSMVSALKTWSERCTSTLDDLEGQVREIRAAAARREREKRAAQDKMQLLVSEARDPERKGEALPRRVLNKRSMMDAGSLGHGESMELDEPTAAAEEKKKRASKRKM